MNEKTLNNTNHATLEKLAKATISEDIIQKIYAQGPEAVVFLVLQMAKLLAEVNGVNAEGKPTSGTPSGCVTPYLKPEAKKRMRKTGREIGYEGAHRVSLEPDEVVELRLEC